MIYIANPPIAECTTAQGLRDELMVDLVRRNQAGRNRALAARTARESNRIACELGALEAMLEFWRSVEIPAA